MKNLIYVTHLQLSHLVLALGFLLTSCQVNPLTPTQEATRAPIDAPTETSLPPTKNQTALATATTTATETPTAVPTQVPSPTVIPTSTPIPSIRLFAPAQWHEQAKAAVEHLNQNSSNGIWCMVPNDSQADIQFVQGDGHLIVGNQPIVLTVPFTTDWEDTTLEYAESVISEGHELVTLLPWSEVTPSQKVLSINGRFPTDENYPLQETWSLQTSPGFKNAAAELKGALLDTDSDVVHLVAVGDIMLDRSLGYAIEQGNVDYPFDSVSRVLQEADITVGNLESALGDIGEPAPKRYQFRAPPETAESLASAGFDIMSLANNHALDFGPESLMQGIELLNNQGIKTAGAGADHKAAHEPVILEKNGLELAFLSYVHVPVEATTGFDTAVWTATQTSPGLAWADPEQITADVNNASSRSDLIVVLLHSGHEYVAAPSEPQIASAQAAIDAGADLVIGHHTHELQGIDFHNDGVIIYGTGNFAFEIDGDPETAIFHIWTDRYGVRQIKIQPAIIQFGGQPRLADETESPAILSQVYYLTNLLNAE